MPIIGRTPKEKLPANKAQDNVVAKGNDIIQRSRYELNIQQNKVMLYLISQIKPDDDISRVYTFSVKDFCQACNISTRSGKNMSAAQDAIKSLADKSIWVQKSPKRKTLLRWLNTVDLDEDTNCFKVTFHQNMIPYLYDLRERYTSYQLSNVLTMKSKYGIRLYELLKSYQKMRSNAITFTFDELKDRLDSDYNRYADFRRFVLEPAIEDINECSDISVEYEPYSASGKQRGFDGITFTINEPTALDKEIRAIRQERKLDLQTKASFKTLIEAITPED